MSKSSPRRFAARRRRILLAGATAALLAAGGCAGSSREVPVDGGTARSPLPGAAGTVIEMRDGRESHAFVPDRITAGQGGPLSVTVRNAGTTRHTFTVDAAGTDIALSPGDEARVELTRLPGGESRYYCRIHEAQGMTGSINVVV